MWETEKKKHNVREEKKIIENLERKKAKRFRRVCKSDCIKNRVFVKSSLVGRALLAVVVQERYCRASVIRRLEEKKVYGETRWARINNDVVDDDDEKLQRLNSRSIFVNFPSTSRVLHFPQGIDSLRLFSAGYMCEWRREERREEKSKKKSLHNKFIYFGLRAPIPSHTHNTFLWMKL